jgi:hypothetical protein
MESIFDYIREQLNLEQEELKEIVPLAVAAPAATTAGYLLYRRRRKKKKQALQQRQKQEGVAMPRALAKQLARTRVGKSGTAATKRAGAVKIKSTRRTGESPARSSKHFLNF